MTTQVLPIEAGADDEGGIGHSAGSLLLVVVEGDGRVSRFNALAGRVFGLLPDDIGQSLYRVPCHLDR